MPCTFPEFLHLCKQRRSLRWYEDKPVTEEDIRKLLGAAILSPSVENSQPWRFHAVLNQDLKRKLMCSCCYGNFIEGAQAMIVVGCDLRSKPSSAKVLWNPEELRYSCAGAMQTVLLAAAAAGLGGCWVSLHHGAAHETLKLSSHEQVIGGLVIGYPKAHKEDVTGMHERKPLDDVLTMHL